ncbi:MAG: 4Fe-4S cluster-binding domain-containing protein [Oscillospiraceae bacterium]|nr:4Fe-4S cluster-binding domain-containing protein [Oscillospiraceae bacterium]
MSYMGLGEIRPENFIEIDNLFEDFIPKHKEIWIFGTGLYGKAFDKYLLQCGVDARGFVVSDDKSYTFVSSKPVMSIDSFKRHYGEESRVGLLLAIDEKYYDEVVPQLMFLGSDLLFLKRLYKQLAADRCGERNKLPVLCFHIADQCNLSCFSCTACSPIADAGIYEIEQFKRDIDHLKRLFDIDSITEINFTGGDVFQNPHFTKMIQITHESYPQSLITFSTNGIGLGNQSDEFWELVSSCGVRIYYTLYPIKYKHDGEIVDKAKKYNVDLVIAGDAVGEDKTSWRIPFVESGKEIVHDFLFCRFHRRCAVIKNGFWAPCCAIRQIPLINNKFNAKIPLSGDDTLDLQKAKSADEVQEFLAKRLPLCDYCALRERKSMGEWLPSRKEKSEWISEGISS